MALGTLANKGRYGDTEIRNVAGSRSHVNRREANLIDLYGALGQSLVQASGAGTINPRTRLREYHDAFDSEGLPMSHEHTTGDLSPSSPIEWGGSPFMDMMAESPLLGGSFKKRDRGQRLNFNADDYRKAVEDEKTEEYFLSIGIPKDKVAYFESNINLAYSGDEGFYKELEKEQMRSAKKSYEFGMQGATLQAGDRLYDIRQEQDIAKQKSGFESSGAVDYAGKRAKKGVFEDYTLQQQQLSENRQKAETSAKFGLETSISDLWHGAGQEYWENLQQLESYEDM
ncbi:hypothetical protein CMI37_23340 [Candidatus Pacearchaeota archaeon]|nr:hypothetical protein [Candidatus Pacearchaeota archaeon]|tara:strand:+ start:1516 stop:2370 length:855 start_codon:yes stop_codon:yes gene_type:complete